MGYKAKQPSPSLNEWDPPLLHQGWHLSQLHVFNLYVSIRYDIFLTRQKGCSVEKAEGNTHHLHS